MTALMPMMLSTAPAPRASLRDVSRPSVLVTGAAGVLGASVVRELGVRDVTCLVHRTPPPGGVRHVEGDVTGPRLGLARGAHRKLAARVDTVIHCAAETDWGRDRDHIAELNLGGTRNVLDFASDAGARVCFVSTAFIQRAEEVAGHVARGEGGLWSGIDAYLQSKLRAEELVRESGLRGTIVRPPVVMGDSTTGATPRFQAIHAVTSLLFRGALPLLPVSAASRIDFLAQDMVAAAIVGLIDSDSGGGEYWLTAGPDALCFPRLVELLVEFGRRIGRELHSPRFVDPEMVDRLIRPAFINGRSRAARMRMEYALSIAGVVASPEPFPSSLPEIRRASGRSLDLALERTLNNGLAYWAGKKGITRAAA